MLRKPVPGQMFGPVERPFDDSEFKARYPSIYEYLTVTRWADGSNRVTSTISVFIDNGALKLVINDRDNNRSAFFSAPTFEDTLVRMEEALTEDSADWKSRNANAAAATRTPF